MTLSRPFRDLSHWDLKRSLGRSWSLRSFWGSWQRRIVLSDVPLDPPQPGAGTRSSIRILTGQGSGPEPIAMVLRDEERAVNEQTSVPSCVLPRRSVKTALSWSLKTIGIGEKPQTPPYEGPGASGCVFSGVFGDPADSTLPSTRLGRGSCVTQRPCHESWDWKICRPSPDPGKHPPIPRDNPRPEPAMRLQGALENAKMPVPDVFGICQSRASPAGLRGQWGGSPDWQSQTGRVEC